MISKDIVVLIGLIVATILFLNLKRLFKINLFKLPTNGIGENNLRRVVPIAPWIIFTATVYFLHQRWWEVWYGTDTLPSPTFWLTQVIAIFAIIALPKKGFWRGVANISLGLAILLSVGIGFMTGAVEKGVVSAPMSLADQAEQKWQITFSDTTEKWGAVVIRDDGKIRVMQHSNVRQSEDKRVYVGECIVNKCKGTFVSQDDIFNSGVFDLRFVGGGSTLVGHMKGDPSRSHPNPYAVEMQIDLVM